MFSILKNPASSVDGAGLCKSYMNCFDSLFLKLKFTRNFPLYNFLQSKSKSSKRMRIFYSYFFAFLFILVQKYNFSLNYTNYLQFFFAICLFFLNSERIDVAVSLFYLVFDSFR